MVLLFQAQYDSLMETNHDFDSDDEDMVAEREEQQVYLSSVNRASRMVCSKV